MKIHLLVSLLTLGDLLYAQHQVKVDSMFEFLKEQGIELNTVTPPVGFKVYYNCDSLLFIKGIFGDTIKIWTSSTDWYTNLTALKDRIKNEAFGKTRFIKSVDEYGRAFISIYDQTEFIYRNDSLFEIENSNPIESASLVQLFSDYFSQKIDEETYEVGLDSLRIIENKMAVYTPKLIFTKNIFRKSKKIKLPRKMNFRGDTIVLEHQWVENGKTCYLIRIKNKEDGEETSYAYAINQDMRFVFWEGCDK